MQTKPIKTDTSFKMLKFVCTLHQDSKKQEPNLHPSPFSHTEYFHRTNREAPEKHRQHTEGSQLSIPVNMGAFLKLIDAILFVFFLVIAVAAPLIDAQTCLPQRLFPHTLIKLKSWYAREYGDYLMTQKPHFFVGVVWLELLFQWPLALANLYGIFASKSWFNTTCLIYGASVFTTMVTILSELIGSGKASDKLLFMYFPFLGLGVLAVLRGLLPPSSTTTSKIGKLGRKKRV